MDDLRDTQQFVFVKRITLGNIIEILVIVSGMLASFLYVKFKQDALERQVADHLVEWQKTKLEYVRADVADERARQNQLRFEEIIRRLERIEKKVER